MRAEWNGANIQLHTQWIFSMYLAIKINFYRLPCLVPRVFMHANTEN